MVGNIGCFTVGCNNAIVGQCSGYKGNCGQFYCHTHAIEKLCSECGGRKAREEKLEQTYQDYLAAAQGIKWPGASIGWGLVFLVIASICLNYSRDGEAAFFFVGVVGLFFYAFIKGHKARMRVKALAEAKPGFLEFYRKWSAAKVKERDEKTLGVILDILGGAVEGAGKGARKSIQIAMEEDRKFREGTPRDVEAAIRDLGKKL